MQKADNNTTVVYSKPNCTYCVKAKHLLKNKGVEFIEMLIGTDISPQQLMEEFEVNKLPAPRTAPQIIFKGKYMGGYHELEKHFNESGE
ncbi:glutaredoxin [bacterium]|jgi:glutaredoxin 3|nr:glutaredoxin [bacterium]|tara:strand:- start:5448 stop:5714 length:267 start_codon:yes stop_codon:yes gene_type:complete